MELDLNVKCCSKCDETYSIENFYKIGNICKNCNNEKRRNKYKNDDEFRKKIIIENTKMKSEKALIKNNEKEKQVKKIGVENKICK